MDSVVLWLQSCVSDLILNSISFGDLCVVSFGLHHDTGNLCDSSVASHLQPEQKSNQPEEVKTPVRV